MKSSDYNLCNVCGKTYQYKRRWFPMEKLGVGRIKKLKTYTAHAYCRHLWKWKMEKEMELFCIIHKIQQLQKGNH